MANLVLKNNTSGGATSITADRFLGAANHLYLNPASRPTSIDVSLGSSDYINKVTYTMAASATSTGKPPVDSHILTFGWDTYVGWGAQLAIGNNQSNHLYLRGSDGVDGTSSWGTWKTILDSNNYNSYAPTLTGNGASGNWSINAASATKLQTARTIFGQSFDGTGNINGQGLFFGTYVAAASRYAWSGLQILENDLVKGNQSDVGYGPSIGFHWRGVTGGTLTMGSDGNFYLRKIDGTTRAYLDAMVSIADTVDGYHAYSFMKTGWSDSTDLNACINSGVYRLSTGFSNAPSNYAYGNLFVLHGAADTIAQMVFPYSSGAVSYRYGNPSQVGGTGAWQGWKYLLRSTTATPYGSSLPTSGMTAGDIFFKI